MEHFRCSSAGTLLWQTNYSKWILLWNQYSLWSKISVKEDNEVRSEEDGTSKQAHVNLVNKQPSDFRLHHVLRCLTVVWSQFWTTSKFLPAPETTTNNQEVKRSLYRLQNVNNFPKDYIRMYPGCQRFYFSFARSERLKRRGRRKINLWSQRLWTSLPCKFGIRYLAKPVFYVFVCFYNFTACKVTFFNGKFTLKSLISYWKYICWRKETKHNSNLHEYHQEFAYDTFHIHFIWRRNYFQLTI